MIRLKKILQEQITAEKLRQYVNTKWLSEQDIENLLVQDEGAALIANQFGETLDTGKTPIQQPMMGAWSKVWWLQSGKVLKITGNGDEGQQVGGYPQLIERLPYEHRNHRPAPIGIHDDVLQGTTLHVCPF